MDRRNFLATTGRFGLASTLFPGILYTLATQAAPEAAPRARSKNPPNPTSPKLPPR